MKLNRKQEAALIGMVLGDGYLQKTGDKNARLRLEHCARQKDYLEWKIKLFPKLFQGQPTSLARKHPITQKTYNYVRGQSNSSPVLGKFRKIFYPDNKKHIPKNLEKLLKDDIALAIWYFDDGYYYPRDKCAYIYLGRIPKNEAETAAGAIKKIFGLENKILDKKQKGFVVYFPPREIEKLKLLVGKYQIPSLTYKTNFT